MVKGELVKETTSKEVSKVKQGERLLPFIESVVLDVDLKAKTMLVDWDADF
jgi:16S rRNA processing protein RimM